MVRFVVRFVRRKVVRFVYDYKTQKFAALQLVTASHTQKKSKRPLSRVNLYTTCAASDEAR